MLRLPILLDFGKAKDLNKLNKSESEKYSRLIDIDSLGYLFHHLLTGLDKYYKNYYAPPDHDRFKILTQKERAKYLKEYIVSL